jgi:putative phosphoesterase
LGFLKIQQLKKILLLSDTHSHIDERIMSYIQAADEIWHAGDIGRLAVTDEIEKTKPLRAVFGNIDDAKARLSFPENNFFEIEGVSFLMTHIGGPAGKYTQRVRDLLAHYRPQVFICGHSHILKVQYIKQYKMMHINPGAAGIHGFHQIRTMIRFTIDQGRLKEMEVIELGLRGKALSQSID